MTNHIDEPRYRCWVAFIPLDKSPEGEKLAFEEMKEIIKLNEIELITKFHPTSTMVLLHINEPDLNFLKLSTFYSKVELFQKAYRELPHISAFKETKEF